MAGEKPSAWGLAQARGTVSLGTCNCVSPGREPCFVHAAVARAIDASREEGRNEGRREREGEIVGWLRGEAASALNILDVAEDIERGAGRKENDRG